MLDLSGAGAWNAELSNALVRRGAGAVGGEG